MDFSTSSFWQALGIALAFLLLGNSLLRRKPHAMRRFHKAWLLVASMALLGMASLATLGIFLSVMLVAYAGCKAGRKLGGCARKWLLGVLIVLLLLPLLYYKYAYFLGHGVLGQEWDTLRDLAIPIGISFYTFQIIGFCVDTLMRGQAMPTWIDYMNFGAFFPQIVAGPIERREDLLPQVQNPDLRLKAANCEVGVPYIVLGLFFKLSLADNLALAFWQNCWGNAWLIWFNNLLFAFRIYFDFAGYGLTAYGIARCLGITLRMNFLSPYTAGNISEFWRRWHTSLTLWFRDYIYFPLGGSRTRRWAANLMIVFLISGLWHGAGWNFLIWGGLSGVAMAAHRLFRKAGGKLPGLIGWLLTFGSMLFIWMFFYDTQQFFLEKHLEIIFNAEEYDARNFLYALTAHKMRGATAVCMAALSFLVIILEYVSQRKLKDPYRIFLHPAACGVLAFLVALLCPGVQNQFIYFAF